MQHFYTRHNTELPSCAFSKGIKKHDAIAAKQMVPLLMAMHVSIGSDNSILTNSNDQQELQCFMSEFLRLLRNLHQRVYTEHELVECEGHMLRVLAAMKLMFMQESKSQFQFIKFHIVKHVFWQIRWARPAVACLCLRCGGRILDAEPAYNLRRPHIVCGCLRLEAATAYRMR